MRNHAELNFHTAAMGGGKSVYLLLAEHQLSDKIPTLITKPARDLKAGTSVETRLGNTQRETDFLISKHTSLEEVIDETLKKRQHEFGAAVMARTPYVFIDEGQFLTPKHIREMRELADADIANFEVYGLRTDFQGNFFPGSEELLKLSDHIETIKPADVEFLCDREECTRIAIYNARLVNGVFTRTGEQVAIDGIDATYVALCSQHYRTPDTP